MKYFVVHICTQDGEQEYGEQLVSEARDATDAKRRTRIDLLATLGNPGEDTGEARGGACTADSPTYSLHPAGI